MNDLVPVKQEGRQSLQKHFDKSFADHLETLKTAVASLPEERQMKVIISITDAARIDYV